MKHLAPRPLTHLAFSHLADIQPGAPQSHFLPLKLLVSAEELSADVTRRPLDVVLQHLDDAVNGPAMIHVVSEINIERPLILGNCCDREFNYGKIFNLVKSRNC
jgi:hypothetical protein